MQVLKEATDEDIKLAKINAIKNLVGDQADKFNLDGMNPEELDQLFAELSKATIEENNESISRYLRFNEEVALYLLQKNLGMKLSEAVIVLEDYKDICQK